MPELFKKVATVLTRKQTKEAKMACKGHLHRTIGDRLTSLLALGESRHECKINGTDKDKIFSINTIEQYRRVGDYFADYVISQNPSVRGLRQAEKYIDGFLQHLKDDGKSAWTQQCYRSALTKIYGEDKSTVELDSKRRADIKRSRYDTESARHFSEARNAELANFCQHTGLRRSELERLTPDQLHQNKEGNYFLRVTGKGGKERDAYILNNDKCVIDRILSTESDKPVWGKVHSKCNVHGYRADYAKALYEQLARPIEEVPQSERYVCRDDKYGEVYDKVAMRQVSNNLGHNRIDVIASNYLY